MSRKLLVALGIIAGIVFLVIALVYFTHDANKLPSFFPGHDLSDTKVHVKHGIASVIVGLGAFVFAWFQSGPKHQNTPPAQS